MLTKLGGGDRIDPTNHSKRKLCLEVFFIFDIFELNSWYPRYSTVLFSLQYNALAYTFEKAC